MNVENINAISAHMSYPVWSPLQGVRAENALAEKTNFSIYTCILWVRWTLHVNMEDVLSHRSEIFNSMVLARTTNKSARDGKWGL